MASNLNAYAGARPLQGSVVDDLQQQEENNFRRRQEKRIEDQIAEQRKEKEEAKKEKLRQEMLGKIPKNFDTGSSSLNEFNGKLIQQGVNRLGEIYTRLGQPGIPDDERIKLQIEAQNIENLPSNIKLATDNFSSLIQDYQKGKGVKHFENPDFERLVLSGFDNYVGTLDNGLPTVGFIDRNGDGTVDVKDVQPFENLANGIGTWEFQPLYNLENMAVSTAEKLGTTDVTTDSNFVSRQIKGPNIDALNTVTEKIFVTDTGEPSDAAKSELRKMGLDATPENIEKVKTKFKELVLANTDTIDKTDVDYGARNAANRFSYEVSKDKEKEEPGFGEAVVPSENTWGRQYSQIDPNKVRSIPITGGVKLASIPLNIPAVDAEGKPVKDSKGKQVFENVTDANVENYTYNKNGQMVVDVSYSVDVKKRTVDDGIEKEVTTSKEKRRQQIAVSPETESRIAKQLGVKKREMREMATVQGETAAERARRIANGG